MNGGDTVLMDEGDEGEREDVAFDAQDYRIVVPIVQKRETNLVIDESYRMFVTYDGEAHALPRNSFSTALALLIIGGVVAHQIATSLNKTTLWLVSIVDTLFERIQNVLQKTNAVFASRRTGRSLSNVKKILVILAILLFLLDKLRVIDVTVVPKWFFF